MAARYSCTKYNIVVSDNCTQCRDPEIYCKFRSSCPIWFIDKRGGESIDADKAEKISKTKPTDHCYQEREMHMLNDVYECEKCNHSLERLVLKEDTESISCPKCGNSQLKKLKCSESFMSSTSIGACCINAPKGFS